MGRYYDIKISSTFTEGSAGPASGTVSQGFTYTSVVNGVFDPNALLVEFDFFSYNYAESKDGATITIHGVGLPNITQAQKFTGRVVQVRAGMSGGLPLEDPTQKGLILSGQIVQSWANWVGTEMDLNLLVFPSRFTYATPGNFVFNWLPGVSLKDALAVTLGTAFAGTGIGVVFNLSKTYTLGRPVISQHGTLPELAALVLSNTQTPNANLVDSATGIVLSSGVTISTPVNNTIYVSDNLFSEGGQEKQINYNDLIGQPTWVGNASMMLTTVMRGDIQVGSVLRMPQGPGLGGVGSVTLSGVGNAGLAVQPSNINYQTAFQGLFSVTAVRHIGNSRDISPTAWVSVFECTPQTTTSITPTTATPGAFVGG